jgi:transcriptional regulator with XRE-family HTH domain
VDSFPVELWAAARAGDHGSVLRLARRAHGWNQTELGRRAGYTQSGISRLESGNRKITDVGKLRHLATVLELPPAAFGLEHTPPDLIKATPHRAQYPPPRQRPPTLGRVPITNPAHNRDPSPHRAGIDDRAFEEDDPVRRRAFLIAAGLTGASLGAAAIPARPTVFGAGLDPAAVLSDQLERALTHTTPADVPPVSAAALRRTLSEAHADFHASRYLTLAHKLPALINTAEASAANTADPASHNELANTYNLVTRALIKLRKGDYEWLSADRALRAARHSDNPLTHAEAERLLGSVLRRAGHHDRAQALTLAAANTLDVTDRASAQHLALYGTLLCSAGYAAARAGDRHRATDLLTEANTTATRLTHQPLRNALAANVISHQVSTAYLLGDAGTAIEHAHTANLATFPTPERQGRLLVDVALAYAQWNKPRPAYHALLAAERAAPQEVHTRTTVRDLVTTLLNHTTTIPGLPHLAQRVHVIQGER